MIDGITTLILIIVNIVFGLRAFTFASELKSEISAKSSSMTVLYGIQNELLTPTSKSLLPLNSDKAKDCYNRAKKSIRIIYLAFIVCFLIQQPWNWR